jgi:hypothetical protein
LKSTDLIAKSVLFYFIKTLTGNSLATMMSATTTAATMFSECRRQYGNQADCQRY